MEFMHQGFTPEERHKQMAAVAKIIEQSGMIPQAMIAREVEWFYESLGIEDIFFQGESVEKLAEFILSVYASKILSFAKHRNTADIVLEHRSERGAIFLCNSQPGVSVSHGPEFERKIDEEYLNPNQQRTQRYRVETYRSRGVLSDTTPVQLRCYFVEECIFPHPNADPMETDLQIVANRNFLDNATENTMDVYQRLMKKAVVRTGPVIEEYAYDEIEERRIVVAYRHSEAANFFSALSDLYHFYDLYSTRKFVEQFSNGMTIISLYLLQLEDSNKPPLDQCVTQIVKEISLLFVLPTTPLQSLFHSKVLSVQEMAYAYSGWQFAEHFLNRLGTEYVALQEVLSRMAISSGDSALYAPLLSKLKTRLRMDTFTSEFIIETIKKYPELVRQVYAHFANVHHVSSPPAQSTKFGASGYACCSLTRVVRCCGRRCRRADRIGGRGGRARRSLSRMRFDEIQLYTGDALVQYMRKTVENTNELLVFESLLTFTTHILKTNFFQPTKVALSFRLDPKFLRPTEYPKPVFGMFFIVAQEFRGFHVRFSDVARGGIRIIRSANREAYHKNITSLFDENYDLAHTQQRKNKDIPEGGSKGTILLDLAYQNHAERAFKKYVDGILDLLLIGQTPGIKNVIVDKYGKPELLFFGPDEGTAEYMDWASLHARHRCVVAGAVDGVRRGRVSSRAHQRAPPRTQECAVLEGLHNRPQPSDWWHSARFVRHDDAVHPSVRARNAGKVQFERRGH